MFENTPHIGWPWFIKGFDSEQIEYLAEGYTPILFEKNKNFVREYNIHNYCYIVKKGLVQLEVSNLKGDFLIVLYASEGHTLYELAAILDQDTDLVRATTLQDTYVYQIPLNVFKERLNNRPNLLWDFIDMIATKSIIWMNQIKIIALSNSVDRVKRVLYLYFTSMGEKTTTGYRLAKKISWELLLTKILVKLQDSQECQYLIVSMNFIAKISFIKTKNITMSNL